MQSFAIGPDLRKLGLEGLRACPVPILPLISDSTRVGKVPVVTFIRHSTLGIFFFTLKSEPEFMKILKYLLKSGSQTITLIII